MMTASDRLKVYYPHGGLHLLLHWYSPHDRGHVIVARTERALKATFAAVLREEPYAEVNGCWRVDIVAPSAAMHADYAAWCHRERVRKFWVRLGVLISQYVKARGVLPRGLTRCPRYEPTIDVTDEDDPSYAAECMAKHHFCANCADGVAPDGMTLEEFYARKHTQFERLIEREQPITMSLADRDRVRPDPSRESSAPPARDEDLLGAVIASHGAHASGTYVVTPRLTDVGHGPWTKGVLFYFRDAVPLESSAYKQAAARAAEEDTAELAIAQAHEDQQRQLQEQAMLERLDEFFD
jgi:hypothetical protein